MIIEQLDSVAIQRIGEVDRSEHITREYVYVQGRLEVREIDCHVPRWSMDASSNFSVQTMIQQFEPILAHGGVMLGAIDNEWLVGFAVLRYDLSASVSQLAGLYVGNGHRRLGIATTLCQEVIRLAKRRGARQLYVSATPSGSAVGFYRNLGFQLAPEVNKELYALEPDDIHMILDLDLPTANSG